MDPNSNVISLTDGAIFVCVLDSTGNYGSNIEWRGKTLGGWSVDGTSIIADKQIMVGDGAGIVVFNNIRVDSSGNESIGKKAVKAPILLQVSGEVDLECRNLIPSGWSITGNSTPSDVKLNAIVPTDLNGNTISLTDGAVFICIIDEDGNYGDNIEWRGKTLGGWSVDGATVVSDSVTIEAGKGFAINNTVKADANGNESTGKKATATSIYLTLPSPISAQ